MLVLTRHPDEVICIGQDIRITVVSVRDGTVRLGITAPREVSVHREEIWRLLQAQQAAEAPPEPDRP